MSAKSTFGIPELLICQTLSGEFQDRICSTLSGESDGAEARDKTAACFGGLAREPAAKSIPKVSCEPSKYFFTVLRFLLAGLFVLNDTPADLPVRRGHQCVDAARRRSTRRFQQGDYAAEMSSYSPRATCFNDFDFAPFFFMIVKVSPRA